MLHLLQPIWLFATAGIIAPVVIHLWNDRQGKVLAIGSIVLLEKTSRKKARSRRVSEWVLLLLRCLLLILLALLLAGPYWKKGPGGEKKGWVLVGGMEAGGLHTIDSLIKDGYERHDLQDSCWWEAFGRLDRQAPAGVPFYVFTDGYLRHFSSVRPVTDRPVHWYTDMAADSVVRWVDKRWLLSDDSVRVITGVSGVTGISYGHENVIRQPGTSVDTTALRVVIYADGIDGQWVTAAVKAVQQYTRRSITVTNKKVQNAHAATTAADWAFWLSTTPPPDLQAANIVLYEPGKEVPVDTWIRGMDVQVEKVMGQSEQAGELQPIWVDGFGRPLLGLEVNAGGKRYHFFSRFNPAWNGLVWSAGFSFYLQALLLEQGAHGHDRRAIDPAQVLPANGIAADRRQAREGGVMTPEPAGTTVDLAPAGWLLVWLLLLIERLVAFTRSKDRMNG